MKTYREFVQGIDLMVASIYMVDAFMQRSELVPSYYYQTNTNSYKGDDLDIEHIEQLPRKKVMVKVALSQPPVEMELYVEDSWAYLITEI